jgi:hypothetical protein
VLDSYRARPQRFQLVHRAIDEFHPAALAVAERWFSRVYRALQTIADEGVRVKALKPVPSRLTAFIILALVVHALRSDKLQDRMTPGFSAADLFAALEDLILMLLAVPQREKQRLSARQPETKKVAILPRGLSKVNTR